MKVLWNYQDIMNRLGYISSRTAWEGM